MIMEARRCVLCGHLTSAMGGCGGRYETLVGEKVWVCGCHPKTNEKSEDDEREAQEDLYSVLYPPV